ncbi:MAG: Ig-like domain-containing protein [Candidatus Polarisedimenticolia bacterium]
MANALEPPPHGDVLSQKRFFKPELYISTSNVLDDSGTLLGARQAALERFFAEHTSQFRVYFDPRSGTPSNLLGSIPLLPGPGVGNDLTLQDVAQRLSRTVVKVDAVVVSDLVRSLIVEHADAFSIDSEQLGGATAAPVADHLWQVSIAQQFDGLPVRHSRIVATINNGNLVLLGTESWGDVGELKTQASITADQALELGFAYVGGRAVEDELWRSPKLEIIPIAPPEHQDGGRFVGPIGAGYAHRLVWSFGFERPPEPARWELLVDAHSGEVLAFEDTNQYATESVSGGVYPITSTEICPTDETCGTMQSAVPMPYADTGLLPPNDFTDAAGQFEHAGGPVTTTLKGRFVWMADTCGVINGTAAGSIDLGGVNGDHDCTSGGGSPGNTATSRTCYYELNQQAAMARGWLPGNVWLQGPLRANVNVAGTCNAFWDRILGSVNFYKSGGGCRNTGEMASVIDHEWGHGLDDNDAGGLLSNSSEAYADIAALYRTQASCLGHGFFHTFNRGCGQTSDGTGFNQNESQTGMHCNLDCSGVRDADWARHIDGLPDTPASWNCVHCGGGTGPCGRQVHCAAAPARQAAWDLVARDLQSPPFDYEPNTAFIIGNKLFYQGSGNIGAWHACTCPDSDGCGAANAYMQWLAADDDNGSLIDGTPHMSALHAAFDRHAIACAAPAPTNSGCAGGPTGAPSLDVIVGSRRLDLSWNAVAGASSYRVFRTEGHAGCAFGKTLIATVAGTSHADTALANDRGYSYVVQAVGASGACFGSASNCVTAAPQLQSCVGAVALGAETYGCAGVLEVSLSDSDLEGAGTAVIEISSTTEPIAETLGLTEVPPNSGVFTGTLATTAAPPVPADGAVSVVDGDTITVRYQDASACGPPSVAEAMSSVDCVGPVVVSISPPDNAAGVPQATVILAQFDEPVDPTTVTTSTFVVLNCTETQVAGTLSVSDDRRAVTFVPTDGLAPDTRYFVSLTSGIEDPLGNGLVPFNSSFLTSSVPAAAVPADSIGASEAGTAIGGPNAGANFGRGVAAVEDIDGDGIGELLVGAPRAQPNGVDSGAAYLIFGGSTGPQEDPTQWVSFLGEAAGDSAGFSVAAAGDVNGDHVPDLLIGAPGNDAAGSGSGRAYVVFGGGNLTPGAVIELAHVGGSVPGVKITGAEAGDQLGFSISGGGDPNVDGTSDVLLGAPFSDPGGDVDAGRAFLLFGPLTPGEISLIDVGEPGTTAAGVVYEGAAAGDETGRSVTLWLDSGTTDGDGFDDVVIGSPGADPVVNSVAYPDGGIVYVVHGGAANLAESPVRLDRVANGGTDAISGVQFQNDFAAERMGTTVGGADFTSTSGTGALAAGAPGDSAQQSAAALCVRKVKVWRPPIVCARCLSVKAKITASNSSASSSIFAMTRSCSAALAAEPAASPTLDFQDLGGLDAGNVLAFVGDVDGLQGEDLAIGVPSEVVGGLDGAGRVFVVSGGSMQPGTVKDLDDVGQTVPGFVLEGDEAQGLLGRSVGGGFDVNGDAVADLLVGGPLINPPSPQQPPATITDAGETFVVSHVPPGAVGSGAAAPLLYSGNNVLEWGGVDRATRYNVYRGLLSTLRSDGRVYTSSMVCLANDTTRDDDADGLPDAADADIPPPGDGFFYLITAENDSGEGSLGTDSAGKLRVNNSPCSGSQTESIPGQGDADGDSFVDLCDNCPTVANANQLDTDGDAAGNACDPDDDNDGLLDTEELALGTDPLLSDTDGDGLSDFDEVRVHGTDPLDPDPDGDGCPDPVELARGSDPHVADTDSDGFLDCADNCPAVANPLQEDADGDSVGDACELHLKAATLDGAGGRMTSPAVSMARASLGQTAAGRSQSPGGEYRLRGGFVAAVAP